MHLRYKRCFGDGERGIRTLVKVTPKQHFQCCAFNHSAISPIKVTINHPTANTAYLSNFFRFSFYLAKQTAEKNPNLSLITNSGVRIKKIEDEKC
jgi:hypothetical protein